MKPALCIIITDGECSVESLRKNFHLSRETAARIKHLKRFWGWLRVCLFHCPFKHDVSCDISSLAVHSESEYLRIREKSCNFMRDVEATRKYVQHLRVRVINYTRMLTCTWSDITRTFGDDMDPIEGIHLLSKNK